MTAQQLYYQTPYHTGADNAHFCVVVSLKPHGADAVVPIFARAILEPLKIPLVGKQDLRNRKLGDGDCVCTPSAEYAHSAQKKIARKPLYRAGGIKDRRKRGQIFGYRLGRERRHAPGRENVLCVSKQLALCLKVIGAELCDIRDFAETGFHALSKLRRISVVNRPG